MDAALSGFKKMRFWGANLMVSRLRKAADSCNNICDTQNIRIRVDGAG